MKKTLTFLLAIGLCSFLSVQAQESNVKIGLKAGANMANVTNSNLSNKTSFHLGAVVDVKLSKSFSIQPEVVYSMQGAQKGKQELNLNYVNIPIMAKLYLYEGLNLQVGPQIGALTSAKIKPGVPTGLGKDLGDINWNDVNQTDINDIIDFLNNGGAMEGVTLSDDIYKDANNIDFSVNFGLGYDFPMGLFVDFRYTMGVTNINKDNVAWANKDLKNNVMQLSIGYKFKTYKPSRY